ncbi:MAG: multiple sugar transport system permease protein [Thermomicrobiales bacterium]|jgi:multiple sugar transport system permease protein|nr:multiple sugar transport system permease protein [Thermomicrobiales bacterium]
MAAVAARSPRGRNPIVAEDRRAGWVFVLPAMVIFGVFIFGAVLFAFYISLHDYKLLQKGGVWQIFVHPGRTWIGIDNYRDIFNSGDFWIAFRNTSWYALGVVPAQTITGLVLAVLANRKIRGKTFFRTAFYFPSISSSVVISVIFLWMYSARGPINYALIQLGFPTPRPVWLANPRGVIAMALEKVGIDSVSVWLEGPSVALLSIMMLNVWTTTGTMMVIFLAGLQNVPGDVYEAAALDGASRFRMFRDITVPLLKPVTAFVITIGLIGTFQVFDQIWVMSEGGPAKKTTTLAYLVYLEGFRQGRGLGYASAIAVILFLIILLLYLIQRRITEEETTR